MKAKVLVAIAVLTLTVGTAAPQTVVHQDVRAVLQAVATTMGTNNLRTVQFSGVGTNRAMGQAYNPATDWPTFEMPSYTRVIDYTAKYSREELTRRQGNNPPRGGGGTPLQGEQRQILVSSGNYAWNVNGQDVVPQPAAAETRLIEILLTPHGFVKGAMEATDTTAVTLMMSGDDGPISKTAGPGGRKVTYIAFTALGKYKIMGAVDDQNIVERVQTWMPNPVLGDQLWNYDYKDFKDYGGVKFPTIIHLHAGDIRNSSHHGIDMTVNSVQTNVAVAAVTVPDAVRQAAVQPVRVESQNLANGVWLIGGGSHNSVAVEFKDFVTVIEAPLNEQRSLAVIREVQRLVPNKVIRYLVNTHHHFDHSGGVRTYIAQGAILVTHETNRDFYDQIVLYPYPRLTQPDILSTYYPRFGPSRRPLFETVSPTPEKAKFVISDGTRTLEMHAVAGLNHSGEMLVAYLPTEKILVNADLYSPPAQGAPAPAVNQSMTALRNNIQRLKLDVARHVPIHGTVGTHADFMKVVGATSN